MFEALVRSSGTMVSADAFAALPARQLGELRADLACPACHADAYFRRESRDGRRACFGARPHEDDCQLASLATENGGSAALDETDERINAGDEFRIEANRTRSIKHVAHDPDASPGTGAAVRYTGRGGREVRVSSMSMDRLLRQLALKDTFRKSRTMLVLSDNSRGAVRTVCKHMNDVTEKDVGRLRVYWGTVRFPRPTDEDGAWLNTGSRHSPSVLVKQDELVHLLDDKNLEDLDDLAGCFFAIMGKLRKSTTSDKLVLFADDLAWFALRPYEEDEGLD